MHREDGVCIVCLCMCVCWYVAIIAKRRVLMLIAGFQASLAKSVPLELPARKSIIM